MVRRTAFAWLAALLVPLLVGGCDLFSAPTQSSTTTGSLPTQTGSVFDAVGSAIQHIHSQLGNPIPLGGTQTTSAANSSTGQ